MLKTNKTKQQKNPKQHSLHFVCFKYTCYWLIIMKLTQIMYNLQTKRFSSWKFFSLTLYRVSDHIWYDQIKKMPELVLYVMVWHQLSGIFL